MKEAISGRVVRRELVLEVFQEAITRTPLLDEAEEDTALRVRDEREQAAWMLNLKLRPGYEPMPHSLRNHRVGSASSARSAMHRLCVR